ncbi:MAG: hypothetical protein AB1440_07990 [Pseudomonadota bacterium]|jgi:hypothetical protein
MRPVLLFVAAVVAFLVWDGLENDGRYRAKIVQSFEQAKNFPGMVKVSWN